MAEGNRLSLKTKKVSRIVVVERAQRHSLITRRELRSPNKEQIQVKRGDTSRFNIF